MRVINRCLWRFTEISKREIPRQLNYLFQLEEAKEIMYQTFKILPFFFDSKWVQSFYESDQLKQSMRQIVSTDLNALELAQNKFLQISNLPPLIENELKNIQTYLFLEYYINWLLKHCKEFNIHKNNYILRIVDLREPKNFTGSERMMPREFIYHHGPTNSGKTSSAIQDLRKLPADKKGVYLAPLRLLAWETQQKLGNCTLLTGQEKDFRVSNLTSSTIEMFSTADNYEVAVIDEIQLISDPYRGFAWTKAVLNVKAKRVHLCGDQRALHLISKLLRPGDTLRERRYSRLSKLVLINNLFHVDDLSVGDCFVELNTKSILRFKNFLNSSQRHFSQNSAAVVYGRLPPSCRKSQAALFNNRELPYLVATNAIGMGLNFNIKRLIFLSLMYKNQQLQKVRLSDHEIQQIAGRAGRGLETGYVQCMDKRDLNTVRKALKNVNQEYQINLQDQSKEQSSLDQKEEVSTTSPLSKVYCKQLQRFLTIKQCEIEKAALLVDMKYVLLVKYEIEEVLNTKIRMSDALRSVFILADINEDLYFIEDHKDVISWLVQIQPIRLNFMYQLYFATRLISCHKGDVFHLLKLDLILQIKKKGVAKIQPDLTEMYRLNFMNFKQLEEIRSIESIYQFLELYTSLSQEYQLSLPDIKLSKEMKNACENRIEAILAQNPPPLPYRTRLVDHFANIKMALTSKLAPFLK